MSRVVYDIETNGLYHEVSQFHCGVVIDIDTNEVFRYRSNRLHEFIDHISSADAAIAHNGIGYDHPTLEKLSGRLIRRDNQLDTLVICRLLWPELKTNDLPLLKRWKYGVTDKPSLPPKLWGLQSLKAWGYRLGELKGDFSEDADWSKFSEEMLEYCVQDCKVTAKLFRLIEKKFESWSWEKPIELEHRIQWTMSQQERNGFYFEREKAVALLSELLAKRYQISDRLKEEFGSWWVSNGITTPKKTLNYKNPLKASLTEGAAYTKLKRVEFNPASRDHIAKVLKERRGWTPVELTENGKAKIDDEVLEHLPWEEAALLKEYFKLNKIIGMLEEGRNGWLKLVTLDSYIHGSINPCGAVTGRATHSNPNIAQVPSSKKPYGHECRSLFSAPEGWRLMGADTAGLELRVLAHYMFRFDGGQYADIVVNGDVHTINQKAAGLATRDMAKTFIYMLLYGAGAAAVGFFLLPTGTPEEQLKAGRAAKRKLMKSIPALRELEKAVKEAAKKGFIRGLDGRRLVVRSEHAALNVLLQSAGAVVCKYWVCEIERLMLERGFKHGRDGDFMMSAWVHK